MLLIARNQARQREFSLRLAIGAGRVGLFRQLLTESLLLVVAGRRAGLDVCRAGERGPWRHGRNWRLVCNPTLRVLLFTLVILALAAALVFRTGAIAQCALRFQPDWR